MDWKVIYEFLKLEARSATISRKTNETDIYINLNLDELAKQNRNWNCLIICLTKLRVTGKWTWKFW
jgi:imidazoleglycerol phosphate dehydratase HisB